ncbi:2OG-Fe(II) oxygenase [Bdellovibrio bacteriovorus]|uniref:2OG-Fe(II) oxygenase n=1 Tax=Bdellovibrio bacteriovorus TaxID=959 RepID=UPI0035A5E53D
MEQNQINLTNLDRMFDDLADHHWAVATEVFSQDFCQALAHECQNLHAAGALNKASIGHSATKTVNAEIRGDFTLWLEQDTGSDLQKQFLAQLEVLRQKLNENFYLGLQRFESHFALYPPGAGYDKHIDNHRGSGARRITFILYLNAHWQKGDGGELSLYSPEDENLLLAQVQPRLGTLVLFRSDLFPHQVEKSHSPRLSLTGWFRNDAS